MRTPNIFISHQWRYDNEYHSLKTKMNELGWKHLDYSVPEHDPFDLTRKKLIESALKEQIRQCNVFIVFARMAAINSSWVETEVKVAKYYNKYILAIRPHGYTGNIPFFIQNAKNEIVGFNTPSIIKKIEKILS